MRLFEPCTRSSRCDSLQSFFNDAYEHDPHRHVVWSAKYFHRTKSNAVRAVVEAKDVLQNPGRMLRLLCEAVGVDFSESMLSWPPGLRDTDGIWAKHLYGEVAKTTSFQPYRATHSEVPARFHETYEHCRECYEQLYRYRLH